MSSSIHLLVNALQADRHRGADRRDEHHRALREQVLDRALRERALGRSPARRRPWESLLARLRPDHSLTPYPCRLPSGDLGRTAIRFLDGEWAVVCVPDRRRRGSAG